jgi:hypothetical protein
MLTAPAPGGAYTITFDTEDIQLVREMLRDRVNIELECAEDLKALGRPFTRELRRAALAMRIDAALDGENAPAAKQPRRRWDD